jgi:hypothetical protein
MVFLRIQVVYGVCHCPSSLFPCIFHYCPLITGSVPESCTQCSSRSTDVCQNCALPFSRQVIICPLVSFHLWQLGHLGETVVSHFEQREFVPAKSHTCLHAQSWNICGTSVSAHDTNSHAISSNCFVDRMLLACFVGVHRDSQVSLLCTQNLMSPTTSDVTFSVPT